MLPSVTLFDNLSVILRIYVIVREAQTGVKQSPLQRVNKLLSSFD